MLTLLPKGVHCPNKVIKTFLIKDFFTFSIGVNDTGGAPFAANISANFRKKFEIALWDTRCLEELIHEKTLKTKISWHCPFNVRM
jgi:hypothetical protein